MQEKFSAFIDKKYIPLDVKLKFGIAVACLLLPVALCYFLLYKPNIEEINNLNNQIAQAQRELDRARKEAADLPKFEQALKDMQKKFQEVAVILPKTTEIPELLRSISDRGKNAGLDFLSFKPGNEIPKDFYAEIPIDISTKGPYHNMGFFLDQVSKLDRLVTVNNIKMSSPVKEGSEILLNSNCRLITYRFTNIELKKEENKK